MKLKLNILILIFFIIKINGNDDFKYYAARTDTRKCDNNERPKCGGYYVKELNTGKEEIEIYVSEINQQDDIGVVNENKIKNAPPFHIVFRGILNRDYLNDVDVAEAHNLYRLMPMPGKTFNLTKDTKFYTLGNPHNLMVPQLNEDDEKNRFKTILCKEYPKYIKNIQTNWMEYLINTGNSVFTVDSVTITNNISNTNSDDINNQYDEEYQQLFLNNEWSPKYEYNIDNLFISLTNSNNCPKKIQEIRCVPGLVATYVRSFNHCYIFFECAPREPQKCLNTIAPICPRGYSLTSIPSYPYGCLVFYCDPSFLFFNY
ncbi:hypothetical protein RB653_008858 [Dictyostelium firmibasis]|uniref:DUF6748 domain-containing protein n=1 Tax=Dictyostelium firmibasis TaxID=79012 RepID=A0AAN7TTD7_9MYCE